MKRNANRLLELVNQLLDFRKIEEDMFRLCFSKQNISEIVRNIHKRYVQYAKLKDIDIRLVEPEKDIACVVDKEAMEKVIGNLLSNAVKYANSLITISISTDNNLLTISVKDDGPGIKSEFIDKIFESFFQIENNAQRTGSGLGLALSITGNKTQREYCSLIRLWAWMYINIHNSYGSSNQYITAYGRVSEKRRYLRTTNCAISCRREVKNSIG